MPDIGFLNGRFMPLNDVTISVEDRGFQFGDGVYEVIRTYSGMPFQLEAHVERLQRSARAIELDTPTKKNGSNGWLKGWGAPAMANAKFTFRSPVDMPRAIMPSRKIFPRPS